MENYCNSNESWLGELRVLKDKYAVSKEPHDLSTSDINMYEFVDLLSANLGGDETVITDAGLCFYIMGQAFKLKKGQRYIVSGDWDLWVMHFLRPLVRVLLQNIP